MKRWEGFGYALFVVDADRTVGSEGSDLYFKASVDGKTYTFVIESYLTGANTDVYKLVKTLAVGDVVNMEGFLYWYEGAQPHIVSVEIVEQ